MTAKHLACQLALVAWTASAPLLVAAPAQSSGETSRASSSGCTTSSPVVTGAMSPSPLLGTNGNKAVIGRDHKIHLVWADQSNVYYKSSADGVAWSAPITLATAGSNQSFQEPAIAVDASGTLGVAFADVNSLVIYYAYRTFGATSFSTPVKAVGPGEAPSMVAVGNRMYLAWDDPWSVQYLDFPSTSPPTNATGIWLTGTSLCASNTHFSWPSIAAMVPPCGGTPVIRIAYYYFSDERQNPYGCVQSYAESGVYVRTAYLYSGSNLAYGNAHTGNPATGWAMAGISVSLAADPSRFYLAWSDVWGTPRTMLASGIASGYWAPAIQISAKRSDIDVAVEEGGSEFRVAWTDPTSTGPYGPAYHRSGTWPVANSAPTWDSPAQAVGASGINGNPQAFFWKRCTNGVLTTVPVIYQLMQSVRSDAIACPANCNVAWLTSTASSC